MTLYFVIQSESSQVSSRLPEQSEMIRFSPGLRVSIICRVSEFLVQFKEDTIISEDLDRIILYLLIQLRVGHPDLWYLWHCGTQQSS